MSAGLTVDIVERVSRESGFEDNSRSNLDSVLICHMEYGYAISGVSSSLWQDADEPPSWVAEASGLANTG